jgi:hypothetical protein
LVAEAVRLSRLLPSLPFSALPFFRASFLPRFRDLKINPSAFRAYGLSLRIYCGSAFTTFFSFAIRLKHG